MSHEIPKLSHKVTLRTYLKALDGLLMPMLLSLLVPSVERAAELTLDLLLAFLETSGDAFLLFLQKKSQFMLKVSHLRVFRGQKLKVSYGFEQTFSFLAASAASSSSSPPAAASPFLSFSWPSVRVSHFAKVV